jgi:hypothetical protein
LDYVESVKQLKRENKHHEAIELLLKLVDAVEREAEIYRAYNWNQCPAPWYYKQLAIIYRKENRFSDELAILERYQKISRGEGSTELNLLLEGARIRSRGIGYIDGRYYTEHKKSVEQLRGENKHQEAIQLKVN